MTGREYTMRCSKPTLERIMSISRHPRGKINTILLPTIPRKAYKKNAIFQHAPLVFAPRWWRVRSRWRRWQVSRDAKPHPASFRLSCLAGSLRECQRSAPKYRWSAAWQSLRRCTLRRPKNNTCASDFGWPSLWASGLVPALISESERLGSGRHEWRDQRSWEGRSWNKEHSSHLTLTCVLRWLIALRGIYSFETVKQNLTLHVGKIRWILQAYWKRHW